MRSVPRTAILHDGLQQGIEVVAGRPMTVSGIGSDPTGRTNCIRSFGRALERGGHMSNEVDDVRLAVQLLNYPNAAQVGLISTDRASKKSGNPNAISSQHRTKISAMQPPSIGLTFSWCM